MENTINKNDNLLGIFSFILGAGGVFLSYFFIFRYLGDILIAETDAAQECSATAPFFIPAFAFIGIAGGILWLVAGLGFFQKKEWNYSIAVIGNIISLFASFWPNIPAMESKAAIPGPWFLIFLPNLVMYFYLVRKKGQESWKKALFGLGVGMAFILEFINGIAATTRMVNRLDNIPSAEMYMITMPGNMIASILFGIAVVGLFLAKKKEWVRIVGITATLLAILAGFPLAIYSMIFAGSDPTFSMFIMGPTVSLLVGILFLSPKIWNKAMNISM